MSSGTATSDTTERGAASEVAQTAKQEASHVASNAADNAKHIASEATTQAKAVAQQAKQQVSTLLDQTRHEVRQTAEQKGQQAATGLRTFADQLRSLASGQPDQAGQLQGYVQDVQERVSSFATRLETEGPQALLEDAKRFARQRPVMFLAAAAGAGFAIGRLVRAGAAASGEQDGGNGRYGSSGARYPASGAYAAPEVAQPVTYPDLSALAAADAPTAPTDAPPTPGWTGDSAGTLRTGETR